MKRHVQRGAVIAGAIVAALLFFLCGAALRLLMGPISLGPFAGAIEDSLNRSVSGLVIRFDQTVLEWSRNDGKINLIVLGTKVFDTNGRIVAQAPKADVDFDVADMMAGKFSVKRFALIGVQLTGVRSADGTLRLGFGPEQSATDLLQTIRAILKNNAQGGGSLQSFAIQNARIAFHDEPTGLFVVAPDATFALKSSGDHFDATLDAAVELSGSPAHIVAKAVLLENGSPQRGTLEIKGLSLPAIAGNSPSLAYLKPFAVTADIDASFELGAGGAVVATAFTAEGTGALRSEIFKAPLPLDKFTLKGRYDGAATRLTLDSVVLGGKRIAGTGKGMLDLNWKGGELSTVTGELDAHDLRLDLPDRFSQILALTRVSLNATYDDAQKKVVWHSVQFTGDELSADLTGTTDFGAQGMAAISLKGVVGAMSSKALIRYWPLHSATGAREWIDANIFEGRLGPFTLDANLPPGALDAESLPDEAMKIDFPFEGVTARYMEGLTLLTRVHGQARLNGDSFHAAVEGGEIGPLAVTGASGDIPNLHVPGAPGFVKAHVEGRIADVLTLIDMQPLGYAKRFGIAPASTDGRAAVDLDFTIPMLKDLSVDQLQVGVQAKVSDMAVPLDARRKVEHAGGTFVIDTKTLTSEGKATVNGVPVSFKWTEDFVPAGDISTRVDVVGLLDAAARSNLGLANPDWLTGPVQASFTLSGLRFHFADASFRADLTNAALSFPALNMAKKIGTAATATADLHYGDKGELDVHNLVLTGDGLEVRGDLGMDADRDIVSASLTTVKAGTNNDFALVVEPIAGGGSNVRIQGKSLDASRYFIIEKKPAGAVQNLTEDATWHEPLGVNAKLDKIVFRENLALHNMTLSASFAANEKITGFTLDAGAPVKGKVTGRFSVANGVRNLNVESDAAGDFVQAITGFPSIRNGAFSVHVAFPVESAARTPPPDYTGSVVMTNITVVDQPFLARLFAAGTLDGPLRLLQGSGIVFAKFEAPFSARGKVLTIKEGRASGYAMGATFDGLVDRRDDHVDLTGSLVPVFSLNSMLGAVPILGDLLVSKKGEGIIGLTYAMKGPIDEPTINVNPLSVLTPGIFRRLFEFGAPKETAQQVAPAPAVPPLPAPKPIPAPVPTE